MLRRYVTADVFADRPFGGNPVAVVLDADGLTDPQMQALAAEFNYIETTFVLPARDPDHTAHVRIFTPDREVPFAGHPNIGTAFLLARHRIAEGGSAPRRFQFEEAAGLVEIELMVENDEVVGAELLAPEALSRATIVAPDAAAACIGLDGQDVRTVIHGPQVISVGLPFLTVELHSRDAFAALVRTDELTMTCSPWTARRRCTSTHATTHLTVPQRIWTCRRGCSHSVWWRIRPPEARQQPSQRCCQTFRAPTLRCGFGRAKTWVGRPRWFREACETAAPSGQRSGAAAPRCSPGHSTWIERQQIQSTGP